MNFSTNTPADRTSRVKAAFAPLSQGWQSRCRFFIGLATLLVLAAIILLIGIKYIFLGYDSINNYVHVWFISDRLYGSGSIPARIPWMEGGESLTYPYGFAPWTLAALFYPVFGDYAVTWTMLLGFILLLLVVYRTRLKSEPWLFILFLLYPFLIEALLSFQMAFIWGSLFGYLYIDALEKKARWRAWLWFVLAISTHLLIVGSILMIYNLFAWIYRKESRRLMLRVMLLSLPILGLVAWYSLKAPSVGDNSASSLILTTLSVVARRSSLFFFPFILVKAKSLFSGKLVGIAPAVLLVIVSISVRVPSYNFADLVHQADNPYKEYLVNSSFEPGATYRILEANDKEQGHYFLVKHGAVLSHELYDQSQHRQSWEHAEYRTFLAEKGIEYVVINRQYNEEFHTNEQQLLDGMVEEGLSKSAYADPEGKFMVFDVRGVRSNAMND